MSSHSRLAKATALVPLAVLSAAWTVNVTGLGGTNAVASGDTAPAADRAVLPDGTPLPPAIGLNHPASVSGPQAQQISDRQASQLVDSAATSGIPAAALAAYQRAATVIDNADTSCHIPWQLIAAIGRVESDHGRADGNTLTSKGISTPGIFGPVLNGRNGTTRIVDTDGGALDGDTRYDRAVGPMQFIPSTWSIVAVDADGDGKRNPQDINDASLATAVYLCSGTENLATTPGQRTAVYRYNHSWSYVRTVLGVEQAYLAGDYTSVPNNSTVAPQPVFEPVPVVNPPRRHRSHPSPSGTTSGSGSPKTPTKTSAPPTTKTPTKTKAPSTKPSTPPVTAPTQNPVTDAAASLAYVTKACTDALTQKYGSTLTGSDLNKAVTQCVAQLDGKTEAQVQAQVQSVVNGLASFVQNLLGNVVGGLLGGS